MGSVRRGGIEAEGWRAFSHEVSQDLADLRGVGDHGHDFNGLARLCLAGADSSELTPRRW